MRFALTSFSREQVSSRLSVGVMVTMTRTDCIFIGIRTHTVCARIPMNMQSFYVGFAQNATSVVLVLMGISMSAATIVFEAGDSVGAFTCVDLDDKPCCTGAQRVMLVLLPAWTVATNRVALGAQGATLVLQPVMTAIPNSVAQGAQGAPKLSGFL